MLTGSSALKLEGTKQITTPKIKAVLKGNLFAEYSNSITGVCQQGIGTYRAAVVFKDNLWVSIAPDTYVFTADGVSFIGKHVNLSPESFMVSGSTLVAYFSGSQLSAFRNYSSQGVSFLLSGKGETLVSGLDYRWITPVGDSQVYGFVNAGNTTFAGTGQRERFDLYSLRHNGSAWGATLLLKRMEYVGATTGVTQTVMGYASRISADTVDRVVMKSSSKVATDTLKVIDTDGLNVYREEDLFPITGSGLERIITPLGMAKSRGTYYLAYKLQDDYFDTTTGVSISKTSISNTRVMASKDMLNWSNSVETKVPHQEAVLFAGESLTTPTEYTVLGVSRGSNTEDIHVSKGVSELDLSENIISYNNSNNERITLTLGNYK